MTRTIENSFLKISVSDHGAELTGIYDKTNDREILWQADPAYWKRHAPVLFPNVGRNYKDIWRLNGKEYPSSQHGFARDSDFICTDITDTSLSFVLKSSEETLNVYPSTRTAIHLLPAAQAAVKGCAVSRHFPGCADLVLSAFRPYAVIAEKRLAG